MLLINKKVVDLGRVVDFCNLDLISYNLPPKTSYIQRIIPITYKAS